jgi:hypothetical protein
MNRARIIPTVKPESQAEPPLLTPLRTTALPVYLLLNAWDGLSAPATVRPDATIVRDYNGCIALTRRRRIISRKLAFRYLGSTGHYLAC